MESREFANMVGRKCTADFKFNQQFLRDLHGRELSAGCGVTQVFRFPPPQFPPGAAIGETNVAHDRITPLTAKEMNALASRFEARAASVLLRDQPEMQSDMRLAARLISEWTGRTETATADDALARSGPVR